MTPLDGWRALTWTGRAIVGVAVVVAVGVALWVATAPVRAHRAAETAKIAIRQSEARAASTMAATETVDSIGRHSAELDNINRENERRIEDAKDSLSGRTRVVSRGLCEYPSYRATKDCVQLLGPVKNVGAGGGSKSAER